MLFYFQNITSSRSLLYTPSVLAAAGPAVVQFVVAMPRPAKEVELTEEQEWFLTQLDRRLEWMFQQLANPPVQISSMFFVFLSLSVFR